MRPVVPVSKITYSFLPPRSTGLPLLMTCQCAEHATAPPSSLGPTCLRRSTAREGATHSRVFEQAALIIVASMTKKNQVSESRVVLHRVPVDAQVGELYELVSRTLREQRNTGKPQSLLRP